MNKKEYKCTKIVLHIGLLALCINLLLGILTNDYILFISYIPFVLIITIIIYVLERTNLL